MNYFIYLLTVSIAIISLLQASDEISLGLYPLKGGRRKCELSPLDKPLLQTSGRLKIVQLKKYIIKQLKLESTCTSPQAVSFT